MMADIKRKVPNLRFKGFTDDWEQHKLGEIITYYNGKSHEEQFRNAETQNFELVTLKSIDENGNLCSSEKYIDSTNNTLSKNDLIMVLSEQNKGLVGMTTLIPRDNYYVLNQRVALLKLHKNNSPFFLTDAINQHQIFFERMSAGTKVQNISKSNVENFNLYIPNYSEQKEVGHIIALCQNIITLQQRKLALLKQLKKGLLQKMFAEKNSKQPVLRFKGFHDDWEQRKLKDVVEKQIKGKAQFEKLAPGEVEYLDTSRLNGGQAILTNGLKDVTLDDILILWDGSKAGTVYHGFEGALGSTLKAYRTSANSKFVYQYLKRHQDNIYNNYRTPNIPHVQKDFLNVFTISVPVSDEQEKIGSFFQQLDNTIVLQQQKLAKYQSVKKSLLQQMFI